MKRFFTHLIVIIFSTSSLAQSPLTSISRPEESVRSNLNDPLDSLTSSAKQNYIHDSTIIRSWSDTLRARINYRFSSVANSKSIDSLRNLALPEPEIIKRTDSLLQQKMNLLKEVDEKQARLQKRITGRYTSWTENLRKKFNLDSAGVNLPGVPPPVGTTSSPSISKPSIPSADVPLPSLGTEDFSSLGLSPELTGIGGATAIPSTQQLGEWQNSLSSVTNPMGDLQKQVAGFKQITQNPTDAAEQAVTSLAETNDAAKQLNDAEKLKEQAEALKLAEEMKNPEAVKEEAVQYAAKEAQLQGAMSQLSKYKQKYSSISSLSEIPKNDWLPRNGLKGTSFRERFRLGMNLGVRNNSDTLLIDLYPNASYRITGRLEAGLGAIYRLRVSTSPFGLEQSDPVWGVALFSVFKTFKSVFIRVESDVTSHMKYGTGESSPYRDWRWTFYSGVQTNFRLGQRWTGNLQMLYNFDSSLKDGFPEKLAMRFGVQHQLRVKVKR